MATHNIDRAKIVIQNCESINYSDATGHSCDKCKKDLTVHELLLLDDIVDHAENINDDIRQSLFFVAGYIAFRIKNLHL